MRAVAMVGAGGVLSSVVSGPPITIRKVLSEDPEVCHLCVVGSAAGPLPGDDVHFDLRIGEGARARLTATGANLAQGQIGAMASRLVSDVAVLAGGHLDAESAPLIACAGSAVQVEVRVRLADTAGIRWRELLVLGRTDEPAGAVTLSWHVKRASRPVLIQSVDLDHPALRTWPGLLDGRRVMASMLVSEPGLDPSTTVDSPTAICQRIDGDTALITVLDDDADSASQRMQTLVDGLG
ncbi:MAG: urease accessory protein ureD [Frankiales bacterium]|nr:urease accessory protein ureD [Frankiales bacterium]